MPAKILWMIAVAAVCCCDSAIAVAAGPPRHAPTSVDGSPGYSRPDASKASRRAKKNAVQTQAADHGRHVDPAAPYKAHRLSSPRASQPIANLAGQTTVLTREVLDDMKATSLGDALRSTAGVTVGR